MQEPNAVFSESGEPTYPLTIRIANGGGWLARQRGNERSPLCRSHAAGSSRSSACLPWLLLALGIGATAAVIQAFGSESSADASALPESGPHCSDSAGPRRTERDGRTAWELAGGSKWLEWQKEAKSFEAVAAYAWTFNFLVREQGSESLEGMMVTKGLLPGDRFTAAVGANIFGGGGRAISVAGDHPQL